MRRQDFQSRRGGGDRFREQDQGGRYADQGRGRSYQEGFYGPGISNFGQGQGSGQGQRGQYGQDFESGSDWGAQGWNNQGAMGYGESGERGDEGMGGGYGGRFGGREDFGGRGQQDFQRAQWGQTRGGQHNIGSGFGGYNQGFGGTQGQWAGGQGDWGGGQGNWGQGSQGNFGQGSRYSGYGQDFGQQSGGQGQYGYGSQGGMGRDRQGVKGYTRSDERIKDDVCERLYNEGRIEVRDVSVEVTDGKVMLEGTVPNRHMKHQIEDIVDQCIGVKEVENHIRVSRGQGESDASGGELHAAGSTQQGSQQGRARRDQH